MGTVSGCEGTTHSALRSSHIQRIHFEEFQTELQRSRALNERVSEMSDRIETLSDEKNCVVDELERQLTSNKELRDQLKKSQEKQNEIRLNSILDNVKLEADIKRLEVERNATMKELKRMTEKYHHLQEKIHLCLAPLHEQRKMVDSFSLVSSEEDQDCGLANNMFDLAAFEEDFSLPEPAGDILTPHANEDGAGTGTGGSAVGREKRSSSTMSCGVFPETDEMSAFDDDDTEDSAGEGFVFEKADSPPPKKRFPPTFVEDRAGAGGFKDVLSERGLEGGKKKKEERKIPIPTTAVSVKSNFGNAPQGGGRNLSVGNLLLAIRSFDRNQLNVVKGRQREPKRKKEKRMPYCVSNILQRQFVAYSKDRKRVIEEQRIVRDEVTDW